MLLLLDNPFLRLIVDLLNYFVLISIFFYIYKKKIISHRELMIYSVFCATPFFVTYVAMIGMQFPLYETIFNSYKKGKTAEEF